jgi:hypothetical protein
MSSSAIYIPISMPIASVGSLPASTQSLILSPTGTRTHHQHQHQHQHHHTDDGKGPGPRVRQSRLESERLRVPVFTQPLIVERILEVGGFEREDIGALMLAWPALRYYEGFKDPAFQYVAAVQFDWCRVVIDDLDDAVAKVADLYDGGLSEGIAEWPEHRLSLSASVDTFVDIMRRANMYKHFWRADTEEMRGNRNMMGECLVLMHEVCPIDSVLHFSVMDALMSLYEPEVETMDGRVISITIDGEEYAI